jgi:hypothetical protein
MQGADHGSGERVEVDHIIILTVRSSLKFYKATLKPGQLLISHVLNEIGSPGTRTKAANVLSYGAQIDWAVSSGGRAPAF